MNSHVFHRSIAVLTLQLTFVFSYASAQLGPTVGSSAQVDNGTNSCTDGGTQIFNSDCTASATIPDNSHGHGGAASHAGYGTPLRAAATAFIAADANLGGTVETIAEASADIIDSLTITGLKTGQAAYLTGRFNALPRPEGNVGATAVYTNTLYNSIYTGQCQVEYHTPPTCTISIPIVFGSDGQPLPFTLERNLDVRAIARMIDPPSGTYDLVETAVGSPGGNGSGGATVKITVRNGKGYKIPGVSVIGSTGYVYE